MIGTLFLVGMLATAAPVLVEGELVHDGQAYALYPATLATCPDIPSPCTTAGGHEFVVIQLHDATFAIADVTRTDHDRQCDRDTDDFPQLGLTGRHDPDQLHALTHINGLPLADIDRDAAPGALSTEGFVAADETVRSVLLGDDALVAAMDLTHAELARPLLHVWNLMQTDLDLGRWSMADHQWLNVRAMKYNGHWVLLDAHDTKGGQQSPFGDGLEGGFWIVIRRALTPQEEEFLHAHYDHASPSAWDPMHGTLTRLWIGDMEAYYIQWYGFYEGHTDWRADPVGIARIFGLRSLPRLEQAFPGQLHRVTTAHHVASRR